MPVELPKVLKRNELNVTIEKSDIDCARQPLCRRPKRRASRWVVSMPGDKKRRHSAIRDRLPSAEIVGRSICRPGKNGECKTGICQNGSHGGDGDLVFDAKVVNRCAQ